jgi:hypothetical protein
MDPASFVFLVPIAAIIMGGLVKIARRNVLRLRFGMVETTSTIGGRFI